MCSCKSWGCGNVLCVPIPVILILYYGMDTDVLGSEVRSDLVTEIRHEKQNVSSAAMNL